MAARLTTVLDGGPNAFLAMGGERRVELELVVDHLTHHGVMGAAVLYESPFTDLTPQGPDGLFTNEQVNELVAVLDQVRAAAEITAAATG